MTAEPVAIRPARPGDLTELETLIREHALYERAAPLRADLREALAAMLFVPEPRIHVLVAVEGSVIVGYASWSLEVSTWQADEYGHLDCLYLREGSRGSAVGRALMKAVEVRARRAGIDELQWQTPAWNEGAIRFYRRRGAGDTTKLRFVLPLTGTPATSPHELCQ